MDAGFTVPGDGPGTPFERLTSAVLQRVGDAERVTSVVTAHRPGPELLASVRSLAAQTWTNHEIVLVDDGAPHGYDDTFAAATALDPRVRLLRRTQHAGRYAARNAALDLATGAYVSFQEADAWSHPQRLERQVAALRADPRAAGVTCAARLIGPDLIGPDLVGSSTIRGPLLLRRTAERFDPVRHGGEDELIDRLRTVRASDQELALFLRRDGDRCEPARRAYRSAYRAWHRAGARPAATGRPFPAPWPLLERRGRRAYDVLTVADWTRPDAGLGQLRALQRHGLRVAVLQLGGDGDLDPATQAAINAGEFDQIDPADDVRARLVVVRSPALLAGAPAGGGIRATRVVLEAPAAVTSRRCVAASRRLFHAEPLWAPPGPQGRAALAATPGGAALTEVDVPCTVDPGDWRVDRRDLPTRRPVVGRQCAGERDEWRRLRAELPEHPMLDVRLRDATGAARQAFGLGGPPGSWLVYTAADVTPRAFLQQVDFYLPLPGDRCPADADPGVLAALAAGCVVVLPHRYAPAFGDAAVYSTVPGLTDAVRALHGRPTSLAEQRDRGLDFVRRIHGHDRYAERILALTP